MHGLTKKKQTATDEELKTLVRLDNQIGLIANGFNLDHLNLDKIMQEEEDSVGHLYTKEHALLQEELFFDIGALLQEV